MINTKGQIVETTQANALDTDSTEAAIRRRLSHVLGSESNRSIAEKTGFTSETIRRYRTTGRMKASFLAAISHAYGVSGDWLLMGRGAPYFQSADTNAVTTLLHSIAELISAGELDLGEILTHTGTGENLPEPYEDNASHGGQGAGDARYAEAHELSEV